MVTPGTVGRLGKQGQCMEEEDYGKKELRGYLGNKCVVVVLMFETVSMLKCPSEIQSQCKKFFLGS